ncbi:ABC transporter permease [Fictibacillus macauensis ZFHKF-1]|uniref:ABC transporter permease n=1 Tax=Fictibacillus macauensis ZFHKF-1 TaxID=1196324 RepID=I8UHD1_9BACL|nr:ABC transporter permease [Fictibacillus macauensis]EIT86233.1 ABC transporter permease [Fictibacillus macauensis ZFHKF-1]
MTLLQMAWKNILHNLSMYVLYVFTMILAIITFLTFSVIAREVPSEVASGGFLDLSAFFTGASVILLLFITLFSWCCHAFFLKKRKQEMKLYSMLGMAKKQIGRMLFYEHLLLGVGTLVIGCLIGSALLRLFVMLLMSFMGYEGSVSVSFPASSDLGYTVIIFLGITLLTSVQSYHFSYRLKLSELFQVEGEKVEPTSSWLLVVLAFLCIGVGYRLALENILTSHIWKLLGLLLSPMVIVGLVIIGTFLLFHTVIVLLFKIVKKHKATYWNGLNMVGASQLLHRVKDNAVMLTAVAIISAVTLTVVGTTYASYSINKEYTAVSNPNSMMFINHNAQAVKQINQLIAKDTERPLAYHASVQALLTRADISTLENPFLGQEQEVALISQSMFNKLTSLQRKDEKLTLQGREAVVLTIDYSEPFGANYEGASIPLQVKGKNVELQVKEHIHDSVFNSGTASTTVVLSNDLFHKLLQKKKAERIRYELYQFKDEAHVKGLTEEIEKRLTDQDLFSSYYQEYTEGLGIFGLLLFISSFFGLVFVSAVGTLLYGKLRIEAENNRDRYQLLIKMGVTKKEITASIFRQLCILFSLPLLIGIVHSLVAMMAFSKLFTISLKGPMTVCVILYSGIYCLFFIATLRRYYKTVLS